jgi:hypothetical protein
VSYFVRAKAPPQKTLLGGVVRYDTSRFGRREDAEARMQGIYEFNEDAICEIVESDSPPEIFPHCEGAASQALGSPCEICRKILTVGDARAFAERQKVTP